MELPLLKKIVKCIPLTQEAFDFYVYRVITFGHGDTVESVAKLAKKPVAEIQEAYDNEAKRILDAQIIESRKHVPLSQEDFDRHIHCTITKSGMSVEQLADGLEQPVQRIQEAYDRRRK